MTHYESEQKSAVVVPVRSFRRGKTRLACVKPAAERETLMAEWSAGVLRAAGSLDAFVVTSDHQVASWATQCGAEVLMDHGVGLNAAVSRAAGILAGRGFNRLIVAHGDLPLADDLTWLDRMEGMVVVPDRRFDGTTVLALPMDYRFRFMYGRMSSWSHAREGRELGHHVSVVHDPLLSWDVDLPEDVSIPKGRELVFRERASLVVRAAAVLEEDRFFGSRTPEPLNQHECANNARKALPTVM